MSLALPLTAQIDPFSWMRSLLSPRCLAVPNKPQGLASTPAKGPENADLKGGSVEQRPEASSSEADGEKDPKPEGEQPEQQSAPPSDSKPEGPAPAEPIEPDDVKA